MTERFKIEVTTPGKLVFSDNVEMAVIPGEEGEFGVLAGHSPVISNLKAGVVNIYEKDQITKRIFVAGGFAEVNSTEASVLATDAYDLENVSKDEIQKKIDAAQVKLNTSETEFEKIRAQQVIELNQQILSLLAA